MERNKEHYGYLQYIFRISEGDSFYYYACVLELKKIREILPYTICEVISKPEKIIKLTEVKNQMISLVTREKNQVYLIPTTKLK